MPFALITWAEQSVDSSLAAVLTGAVPLFVIPIAAVLLPTEKITANAVVGILIGLVGVAVVVGFNPASLAGTELVAQLALIGAAASYALGGVYARRNVQGLRPMIPAFFQVTFALVMTAIPALLLERPWEGALTGGRDLRRHLARPARFGRGLPDLLPAARAAGAQRAPRWWPTCCRSGGSCSGRSCSASRSTRG